MQEFRVTTRRRSQLVDVTEQVRAALGELDGAAPVLVYVPHTTAGMTINEHADPAVARDFEAALERIVSEDWPWQHVEEGEENAPTHIRAAFMGSDVLVPVRDGAARARHLAGDLPLRVRRPARALGLRDRARLDRGRRISASASARPRPSPASASASSRGRSPASSARTAPASRRRCARSSGSSTPTRAARPCSACRTGSSTARSTGSAPCSRRARCIRAAPGGTTCACRRPRPGSRRRASRRC